MDCPFCGKEMKEGGVEADRCSLFWRGGGESIRLSESSLFGGEVVEGFYCPDCRQILLPVPEVETFGDRLMKKLDEAADKLSAVTENLGKQQAEKRQQRETNKRKGKDPWEL